MSIEQRIELTVADSESLHHELTSVGLKLFSAYTYWLGVRLASCYDFLS